MGGLSRAFACALGVCVGCGSFGEPPETPSDPPARTEPSPPPASPPPAAESAAAVSAEPPPASPAPQPQTVFTDDFDRDPTDVKGPWTTEYGAVELFAQPAGGKVFRAKADASTTHSVLVKKLDQVSSHVKARAKIRLDLAGAFEWSTDYCAVFDVWVGGHVLASFYLNGSGEWASWLYGPAGGGGNGATFSGVPIKETNDLELDVRWDEKQASLAATINGTTRVAKPIAALAASAYAAPSIAIGPWCFGEKTPQLTAEIDDVVVTTTP